MNEDLDCRAKFANYLCGILVKKNHGDYKSALCEIYDLYNGCFDFIRNIYELVNEDTIPLFFLHESKYKDSEDFGIDKDEFETKIRTAHANCEFLFGTGIQ